MLTKKTMKKRNSHPGLITALLLSFCFCLACGQDDYPSTIKRYSSNEVLTEAWDVVLVKALDARGLLAPHIKAVPGSNRLLHIAYFESIVPEDQEEAITYGLKYLVWDINTGSGEEPESVIHVDNCQGLGFDLDADNTPSVAYQGGVIRMAGQEKQSDAMFSLRGNSEEWDEYTGGIGEVDPSRNPFYTDGLAGADLSLALDSAGSVHMAYQFRYEGIDSMNFEYPDLLYIKKTRTNLSAQVPEEVVEGNTYVNFSTGYQNSTGARCSITTDQDDEPVVIYYAELPASQEGGAETRGLRMARRQGGVWGDPEWIDEGCTVGYISNAAFDQQGRLAVSYYVTEYTDAGGYSHTECLKYARQSDSSSWQVQLVDESTLCGNYCSLAFDSNGIPSIAYYSFKSRGGNNLKNLKLASYNGSTWAIETVASAGDIGLFNSLFFDQGNKATICSYSNTDKSICLFNQK